MVKVEGPIETEGEILHVAIRPAMLYGSECLHERKMPWWTCGRTILDKIQNVKVAIKNKLGVTSITKY